MNNSLWIIIVIIVAFLSFLVGYSRPHDVKKVFSPTASIAAPVQPVASVKNATNTRSG